MAGSTKASIAELGLPRGRSRAKIGRGYFGAIKPSTWLTLRNIREAPITVKSNPAREYAMEVALLASLGWITVVLPDGQSCGAQWLVTEEGAFALSNREHGT